MFIKTNEGYLISTDHITALYPAGECYVVLTDNGESYKVVNSKIEVLLPKEKPKVEPKKVVKKNGNENKAKEKSDKKTSAKGRSASKTKEKV